MPVPGVHGLNGPRSRAFRSARVGSPRHAFISASADATGNEAVRTNELPTKTRPTACVQSHRRHAHSSGPAWYSSWRLPWTAVGSHPRTGPQPRLKSWGDQGLGPNTGGLGVGCGRGSPPSARPLLLWGSGGITPGNVLKTQMLNSALWWLFAEVAENEFGKVMHALLKAIIWWILRDKKHCVTGCNLVLLTNRSGIRAFDRYKNQWPRMTLNGVITADARYLYDSWASCSWLYLSKCNAVH